LLTTGSFAQDNSLNFIVYDIDNFWTAYDKIHGTKDSALQYQYINKLFIEKGSPGLKAIMQARNYSDKSYIDAINNYPLFWNSIRANTLKATGFAADIEADINKIKKIYPGLKPAKIYFTIGALRTGGTTLNGMVLIGSEIALADKSTVTSEFPNTFAHLRPHFDTEPIKDIVLLNVHEYVHTQQKATIIDNLLGQSIMEGVAEFVAVKGTGKPSTTPAVTYGYANNDRIREVFSKQMFNPFTGYWLYSNAPNEFNVRDLGYYVGYAICEKYYEKAADKKQAVKQMIELDYNDQVAVAQFVDKAGWLEKPVDEFRKQFEHDRPTVTGITQFQNGDSSVSPRLTEITIEFSKPMDERYRSFEFGPLGEQHLLRFKKFKQFSADGKSVTFEIELKPSQHYQIIVGSGFRSKETLSLKPYLVDFKTAGQ
jgi:hypothetical protein